MIKRTLTAIVLGGFLAAVPIAYHAGYAKGQADDVAAIRAAIGPILPVGAR